MGLVHAPGDEPPVEAVATVDPAPVENLTVVQVRGGDPGDGDLYRGDGAGIDTGSRIAAVIGVGREVRPSKFSEFFEPPVSVSTSIPPALTVRLEPHRSYVFVPMTTTG